MENTNNCFSITDVAKILGISREAVNSWLVKGYIEYSRVGNLRKIRPEELTKYLEGLGNSKIAMANFDKDIRDYLREKQEAKK